MSSHRLTPEQTKQGQAKAKLTRKWYKATLLAIAKGELECTATQLNALKTFADQMGWVGPKRKVTALRDVPKYKPKPVLTEELISRLNVATIPVINQDSANKAVYGN